MDLIDGKWIAARLTGRHGEKAELATFVGIDGDKLSKILSGDRKVQIEEAPRFVAYFERQAPDATTLPARIDPDDPAPPGSDLVAVYDIHVAAGAGRIPNAYEAVAERLAFPSGYLNAVTSTRRDRLAIVGVVGTSMEPTLHHGDLVMVDMTKTDVNFDGMFVIRVGEALQVKRVDWGPRRRSVIVRSDNPNKLHFPDKEYAEEDEVAVIGRVVWVGAKQP